MERWPRYIRKGHQVRPHLPAGVVEFRPRVGEEHAEQEPVRLAYAVDAYRLPEILPGLTGKTYEVIHPHLEPVLLGRSDRLDDV